jgi:hypothetical protein|tara:strand:+ start:45 stop:518 length:474 start_codon:yes stop_codon:yes gene_type:complete
MALSTSGSISLGTTAGTNRSITAEFTGGAPHALSEYYKNGSYVPSTITTGNAASGYTGPRYNTSNQWRAYDSTLLRWNGTNVYIGYPSTNPFQVGIYEYLRGDLKSYVSGNKSNPIPLYIYEISRRVASTQTTTTVNTSIPADGQIKFSNMYGGRKT